ncbi:uncharacterized protein LOC106012288, partial [Aplysia californica]|uniref:Uncharacterized protein LOC106012288 n=1 Tax=Aplysia californica TaxID=6500 RepID=A0ABM1A3Q4_APLCA
MLQDFDPTAPVGNVLHQDATTKFHRHYEGMQVTLKDGHSLTMGLMEVAGGDASIYKNVFEAIIDRLASCCREKDELTRAKLITSFKAFMNDRCAVNGVFTDQIEKLRTTLLPAVVEN